jgi:hypothetical protein
MECGGEGICQHQRERSTCKECGGGVICQHQSTKGAHVRSAGHLPAPATKEHG